MFGWPKAKSDAVHAVIHEGLREGDVRELEEFILNSETPQRDPSTGLPRLPDGWAWALRGSSLPGALSLLIEDRGNSAPAWNYDLGRGVEPSRGEMRGLAADALYRWRRILERRLNAAPLGQYPPNSVTG